MTRESPRKETEFELPYGYTDEETGRTHRRGVLRMITLADRKWVEGTYNEQVPPSVPVNEAYFDVLYLTRIIVELGEVPFARLDFKSRLQIVEQFVVPDFIALMEAYNRLDPETRQITPSAQSAD